MPERVVNNLPLDIRQTDEAFWIEASVPGFRPEDMEITLAAEITASFDNGVLSVMVPRAKKARPQRIPVTMAGAGQPKVIDATAGLSPASV